MPPRKNKRGDRGSTEDEPRNPKKSNMAAEENIDVEESIEAEFQKMRIPVRRPRSSRLLKP